MHNQIMLCSYAFNNNVTIIRSFIDQAAMIAIVVKANAYGHGLKEIGYLIENNDLVNWVCVFHLSEAVLFRSYGYKKPILVMGDWNCDGTAIFTDETIVSMVDSIERIELLNELGKKIGKRLSVHLKIDTGLCRFGLASESVELFCCQLEKFSWIKVQGIYTHFAQSQLEDQLYTEQQETLFNEIVQRVQKILGSIEYIHAYNSAATMIRSTKNYNFFRIGLALYGYYSSEFAQLQAFKKGVNNVLRPILTLQSYIMSIKLIPKGSLIGYNCTFQAPCDMAIGLVPFGYCDGYEPAFFEKAYGIINGQAVPVIGRIAMNLIVVDIMHCKSALVGTRVSLIDPLLCPADQLCNKAGITNVRTFLSRLNPAIERHICLQSMPHDNCLI
jgi:alanine racemase